MKPQSVSDMTKDKVKLNETIVKLKQEIDGLKKIADASEDK